LREVIGDEAYGRIAAALTGGTLGARPFYLGTVTLPSERHFDVLAHAWDGVLVVEFEPVARSQPAHFRDLYPLVGDFLLKVNEAANVPLLAQLATQHIRSVTGFGRVMVYQFDSDGHGHVMAEARDESYHSYLGQHFPASDIPAQARALYEKNWIRLISDVDYVPARLQPAQHPANGQPLDLTYSTLRSVSPIHIEYLKNMGVRASMSISLLHDDKLWGLIACHHYSGPHFPPYATRAAAEFLGSTLSLRLIDRAEEDEVRRAMRVRSTLAWLTAATLDEERPLAETLLGSPSLLDLLPSDGVVVSMQGQTGSQGIALPAGLAERIAAWAAGRGDDVVVTDSLPREAPELDAPVDLACGVLALPLSEGQFVLWFRGEAVRSIDWGGDPHNKAIAEREGDGVRLSPRKSFDRWREIVRGRSEPWTEHQIDEVSQLRTHLLEALYARSRSIVRAAETLQRSLLTDPDDGGVVETAVRYVPAAREAQVGGDWYDVFPQPDGSTVLVIGDVAGHDTAATACMAQLRGLLRGIAYDSADSPGGVLRRLDAAIEGLRFGVMATVLVARLEQTHAERAAGGTRMRWSSAGHPPPLLATADGDVTVLATARADLLLGVDATAPRAEAEMLLPRGSTVLLYTDGLVERRDQVIDDGIDRLVTALGELSGGPLAEVCDALLTRLVPARGEDDVALIAVRP
ncbi:MAG: SpoIIE family protein phosphatase, partial [Actinomycetes bacterium]